MSLVGIIQQLVREELRGLRVAELGVVEPGGLHPHSGADDKANYSCDVRLRDTGLILKQVPVLTGHVGSAAIPNEGDLVLVLFANGSAHQPLIVGRLYNEEDRPPLNRPDEMVFRLPLAVGDDQSVLASVRNFASEETPRDLTVAMPPEVRVQLQDRRIAAEAGQTRLTLEQPKGGPGSVVVEAGRTRLRMEQDGSVVLESAGNITLRTASGDLVLEGARILLRSTGETQVEAGTEAKVTARLGATLDGGLAAKVRGGTVSIDGITSFSPS